MLTLAEAFEEIRDAPLRKRMLIAAQGDRGT